MSEYNSSLGDLRKLLREKFPVTRGSFAAMATKDICIGILDGSLDAENQVEMWKRSAAGNVVEAEIVEGTHSSTDGDSSRLFSDSEKTALEALKVLSPSLSNKIAKNENLIQDMMQKIEDADKKLAIYEQKPDPEKLEIVNGAIMLDGQDITGSFAFDAALAQANAKYIPKANPLYNFEAWVAKSEAGSVSIKQRYDDFIKLLLADKRIMLIGPPMCGKTSLPVEFAARVGWPVTRIQMNRDMTVQDFVGCYEADTGSTRWVDGPLIHAMKNGHILILDEIDHAPAECTSILHGVLEPDGKLVVTSNGGEVVEPHKNFRVVATSNSSGFGDMTGAHPNAKVQDAALLRRFACAFTVTWMDEDDEIKLLNATTKLDLGSCKKIVELARCTRDLCQTAGTMMYPMTMSHTIEWASTSQLLGSLASAFPLCVLNKLPDADRGSVLEQAQRIWGKSLNFEE